MRTGPAALGHAAIAAFLFCSPLSAAKKPAPITDGVASNELVSVKATLYPDPASIQELLGDPLGGHYIVVDIKLSPTSKYSIDPDDFLLRTDKDGERAHPYQPSQVAGDGALVISTAEDEQKDAKKKKGGLAMGGGMGPVMGGSSPGVPVSTTPAKVVMDEGKGDRKPIQTVLELRMLPQKEVEETADGLLYFPMEKQKIKDLELVVTTPKGKLNIRFTK